VGGTRSFVSPDAVAVTGRVLLAILFVMSGIGKVAAPGMTLAYIKAAGLPFAPLALGGSAVVELVGGTVLILGYRTRLAAMALAGFSVVAAMFFHSNFADQNQMIHFLKNVAIAGGLLQVAAFGGGGFSVDGRRK
jgi:putative oxidoreductase